MNSASRDEIKLRMIVLTKTAPDDTNTLKLAREIQAKIKEGTPFAEMASVYSQGSQQHQGGDWGWVQRSVLRKELADAAFVLPPGTVSDIVDTPDTCYLMLVEDKHASHVRPLTDVAVDIEKNLRLKQQAKLQKDWIEGLKKKPSSATSEIQSWTSNCECKPRRQKSIRNSRFAMRNLTWAGLAFPSATPPASAPKSRSRPSPPKRHMMRPNIFSSAMNITPLIWPAASSSICR